MSIEATRQKLEWLEGLHGIRQRRLQECEGKSRWPVEDLGAKRRDIEMIEWLRSDYERVLERQQAAAQ